MDRLSHFVLLDYAAVFLLITTLCLIGYLIENSSEKRPSVSVLMARYRREWMLQMLSRDPRIFDAQILASLRQGTSFFASATMIAIGGCLALLGNTERLMGIAQDLTLDSNPIVVWEVKVLVILIFLANSFLKFVWANRLFGYCAVLMASVPNDPNDREALPRAKQAGEINITGARSFNRGLRSVYFALAATAWLLGPGALIGATLVTCLVLLRREFASQSHKILMRPELGATHKDVIPNKP
jgi:uncharacterized membrane protein